jgi:hypothetical protein
MLSDIYLQKGDKQKALVYATDAYEIILNNGSGDHFEIHKNIYAALAHAYAANQNMGLAYTFLDSSRMASDSATKRANALVFAGVQHKTEADKIIEDKAKREREEKINVWFRYGLAAGFVMIGVITLLFVNRQKLRYLHNRQILLNEKFQTESELKSAMEQLAGFTKRISEKNELLEKFTSELDHLRKLNGSNKDVQDISLTELQKSTILNDVQWEKFQNMFDTVHKGFLKRLKEKVPGLSPIEMRFMVLSKLNLTNSEMAGVLGISVEAVQLNRQRLRNKLELIDEDRSLEIFVNKL